MSTTTRQLDIFAAHPGVIDDGRWEPPTQAQLAAYVRPRLAGLLAEARAARRMPWDAQRAEVIAIVFNNWTDRLDEPERGTLRAAFHQEFTRLKAAR